jgi:hypothetical protein
MASLALPCTAKRLSPDHQALLRVSGEKSDIGSLLFFVVFAVKSAIAFTFHAENRAKRHA